MRELYVAALVMMGLMSACGGSKTTETVTETAVETTAEEMAFTRVNCGITLKNAADADRLKELARQLVEASLNDEGVMGYDVLQSISEPTHFMVLETWKNQEVLAQHMETPHFKTLIPQIQELAELDIASFDQPVEPTDKGNGFRVNILFSLDPAKTDALKTAMLPLIEGTHQEKDNNLYDLYLSITKDNEALLLEDWPSEEALNVHKETAHFKENIPAVKEIWTIVSNDRIYK